MQISSFVTFQVTGFHSWPDAPDRLHFLRQPHRHTFKFSIDFPQPEDRGIEFFEYQVHVKDAVHRYIASGQSPLGLDFRDYSCETIARLLAHFLLTSSKYPITDVVVTVSEDGECGSTVSMEVTDLAS